MERFTESGELFGALDNPGPVQGPAGRGETCLYCGKPEGEGVRFVPDLVRHGHPVCRRCEAITAAIQNNPPGLRSKSVSVFADPAEFDATVAAAAAAGVKDRT